MRKLFLILFLVLGVASYGYAANQYGCTAISGGAAGALDALDITGATDPNADNLADGDTAIVVLMSGTTALCYRYVFDADGTTAEASPITIRPDDYATEGVWRLSALQANTDSDGDGSITDESWYTALVTIESINTPSELGGVANISANMTATLGAADYAAARALWDLESGTDFYSMSAANSAFKPLIETPTEIGFNDETPDVSGHYVFVTANAATPTTITQFDSMTAGQSFIVRIGDSSTSIDFSQANLVGNNEISKSMASGDILYCYSADGTVAACAFSSPTLTAGTYIDVSGNTITFDATETDDVTWGAAAGTDKTWTWDTGSGTDPTMNIADGGFTFNLPVIISGTQFKLPSSNADPTATAGYLRHDSTISNFTNGGITYYNGAAIKQLVDMTTATASACTDDQVVAYDADNDLWYCKADSTGAGGDQLVDIVTTGPLTVNAGANVNDALPGSDADITFAIADAAADGSTKGAASFAANDFDASSGNISLDMTNGPIKLISDCSGITSGFCFDTDNGYLWAWDGDSVEEIARPGSVEAIADPDADRIYFWDDSEGVPALLAPDGTTIEISGTTLQVKSGVYQAALTNPVVQADFGFNVFTFLGTPSTTNFFSALTGEGGFAPTLFGYATAAATFTGIKQAATTSATGVSELATTAETTTGTSTSLVVTPDGLSGSVYGQKEIGWTIHDSDDATAIADGKQAAVIPASMNGMNLIDITCSVADLNSASGGTTTVVLRRVRGETAVDMTSTGVTIDYTAYTASDETVNTSNDDVATGDKIYVDINAVTSGAAQLGLSCTAVFQTP